MPHAEYSNRTHPWKTVRDLVLIVLLTILCYLGFRTLSVQWPTKGVTPYYPLHLIPLSGAIAAQIYLIRKYHWSRNLPLGRVGLLVLLSVIMNLAFSLGIYEIPRVLPYALACTFSFLLITHALLRRIGLILTGLFLFVETLQNAAYLLFGIEIDALVLQQIFAANESEIRAYLTLQNIGAAAIAVVGIAALLYIVHRTLKNTARAAQLLWGSCILFLTLLIAGMDPGCPIENGATDAELWPFTRIVRTVDAVTKARESTDKLLSHYAQLPSPAEKATGIRSVSADSGVVCILHIGESVRADHLPMNGYERDTTPCIGKFKDFTINFHDCVSSAPFTIYAIPVILSDARRRFDEGKSNLSEGSCGSVMDLFRKNGFYCSLYYEHNAKGFIGKDPCSKLLFYLSRSSHERILTQCPTDKQTDKMCERLRGKDCNEFILVYNNGSHTPYYNFDPENPPFRPEADKTVVWKNEKTAQDREIIVNRYDNTIHYTDHNIGRVLDSLKGKPYIYIYTSDHGDPLGEGGLWTRDASITGCGTYHTHSICRVPLFIIYSPEFEALHPHFAEALQQLKRNTGKRVAHEFIFHTLLGIFAISSPYYDAQLDLCRPDVQPYSGMHPDDVKKAD